MILGVYVRCRDEENIIEFMNHYYNIGFSYIIILDHMSKIPIIDIISNKIKKNKFKVLRYTIENEQLNSIDFFNKNILPHIIKNMDYCLYIDMDEYLVINNNLNINQVLQQYLPFNMLKINWLFFGNNNHKDLINNCNTLKDKFTKSSNKLNHHVKCLVKVSEIKHTNNSHFFFLNNKNNIKNILNEESDEGPFSFNPTKKNIKEISMYIAHFMVQSTKQFLLRRFTRRTGNVRIMKLGENENKFINFVLDNQNLITDYLHNDDNLLNEINYMKDHFKAIKNFFKIHNCNNIENNIINL